MCHCIIGRMYRAFSAYYLPVRPSCSLVSPKATFRSVWHHRFFVLFLILRQRRGFKPFCCPAEFRGLACRVSRAASSTPSPREGSCAASYRPEAIFSRILLTIVDSANHLLIYLSCSTQSPAVRCGCMPTGSSTVGYCVLLLLFVAFSLLCGNITFSALVMYTLHRRCGVATYTS